MTPTGYKDYDFKLDCDSRRFTPRYVFTLGGKAINWRIVMLRNLALLIEPLKLNMLQTCEAAKEAILLKKNP